MNIRNNYIGILQALEGINGRKAYLATVCNNYLAFCNIILYNICEVRKMNTTFGGIVEEIKKLSFTEKEEIKFLIEKFLIEERREAIYKNYQESLIEIEENKLDFSDDIDILKEML
jgi:hypothetical protein